MNNKTKTCSLCLKVVDKYLADHYYNDIHSFMNVYYFCRECYCDKKNGEVLRKLKLA